MKKFLPLTGKMSGILFFTFFLFLNVYLGIAQSVVTVTTDKDDDYPGEYVIITGTGWEPGESVNFTFEETPKPETCVNSHDYTAIADIQGNIYYNQFLIKENHLGVSFLLTGTGQTSGYVAKTTFTDASWNLTVDIKNFCPGTTRNILFTILQTNNAQKNKSFTVTMPAEFSISNLSNLTPPSGSSWTYSLISSTTICLSGDALSNNDQITFKGDVTAPNTPGTSQLSGMADNKSTCLTSGGFSPTIIDSFTVLSQPTPTFTASPGGISCLNTNITYTTQSGNSNYHWTFPGTAGIDYTIVSGGSTTNNSVALKYMTPGSKTVSVNYTNGNGCTGASSASSTTNVNALVTASFISASATACFEETITYTT